jgi:hypothetical protein
MKYKVEMLFLYGWDDADWRVDGEPLRFDTIEAAQAEINEHVHDYNMHIAGELSIEEMEVPENYRIVEAVD